MLALITHRKPALRGGHVVATSPAVRWSGECLQFGPLSFPGSHSSWSASADALGAGGEETQQLVLVSPGQGAGAVESGKYPVETPPQPPAYRFWDGAAPGLRPALSLCGRPCSGCSWAARWLWPQDRGPAQAWELCPSLGTVTRLLYLPPLPGELPYGPQSPRPPRAITAVGLR